ncbi:polyprenyl synthetase family protein [Elioraea rosea]|uniref:polyprenyl synthetase family protein n=1 Tax=Elioraea rosea TaxID=2492390 RepID=UPI0011845FD5|nr:polyprenyl synthetase family protein [Elioraea rosea]
MDAITRIERALGAALSCTETRGSPPRLGEAMRYAVFPRGSRVRPRLCLAVAYACGDDIPAMADAGAVAIELLHCASLVHDDLPCFDDAEMRRGKPALHRAFGQPLAVLAGDALIIAAFQAIAHASALAPSRAAALMLTIGDSVGMPFGIVAGQAWECEDEVDLEEYQRQKTGSLFAAAAVAGAASAGADAEPWRLFGERLGEAYQVADDLSDAVSEDGESGKTSGRDVMHGRPSAVRSLGIQGAVRRLEELTEAAADAVPACDGAEALKALIRLEARRLLPGKLALSAA